MVCAPVRRDNPRALARRLSTIQAHKPCSISHLSSNVVFETGMDAVFIVNNFSEI